VASNHTKAEARAAASVLKRALAPATAAEWVVGTVNGTGVRTGESNGLVSAGASAPGSELEMGGRLAPVSAAKRARAVGCGDGAGLGTDIGAGVGKGDGTGDGNGDGTLVGQKQHGAGGLERVDQEQRR
jgi:hypothetical protein